MQSKGRPARHNGSTQEQNRGVQPHGPVNRPSWLQCRPLHPGTHRRRCDSNTKRSRLASCLVFSPYALKICGTTSRGPPGKSRSFQRLVEGMHLQGATESPGRQKLGRH